MKNYELLIIFRPNLDADEVDKVVEKTDAGFGELGVKIVSRDKIGRKKLAYEIKNFRDGFFINQILSVPEDKVSELKRQLKLNENVLRVMLLEVSKKAQAV